MKELTIDDLCAETGYTRRTIRYYLQRGLLPPPEGGGRRRIYRRDHLLRLFVIRALQARKYPLEEIRFRLANLRESDLEELLANLGEDAPAVGETVPHQNSPGVSEVCAEEKSHPLPLPPPSIEEQLVAPVVEGVELVARGPMSPRMKARLLEAARRAAEALRGRPVSWLPHPDPTMNALLKRIRNQEEDHDR